jgi:hypothetical protein
MDSLDLSRRAVAAGWKWDEGCCETTGVLPRVGEHYQESSHIADAADYRRGQSLPDFRDAATRGVMLQQVRERWDAPTICTDCDGLRWSVVRVDGTVLAYGDSETAALVAALEAAPKR